MKRSIIIITIVVILFLALGIALVLIFLPMTPPPAPNLSERKALIVGSANDFYSSEVEEEFSGGNDATFVNDQGNWTFSGIHCYDTYYGDNYNMTPGSIAIFTTDPEAMDGTFTLNYSKFYGLEEYAFYSLKASIFIQNPGPVFGPGVRIGLQWLNSIGGVVRTDWSDYENLTLNQWFPMNIGGACNNQSNNEIMELKLLMSFQGVVDLAPDMGVIFDDLIIDKWIAVNNTNPTDPNPPPSIVDSDGFPAQALHVYWILREHGYTDDNIFLMLYHKNDNIIDIEAGDGIPNDLIGAEVDVENDDVNASRFKQELNPSISNSFASDVDNNDQLIIFMTDHGSNRKLGDGNATFHFEADNSYISEFEFFNLVAGLTYERLMINVDCCFSGNFLSKDSNIGVSWYEVPNCIFISAASNVFSWYWINNLNGDGFAGSWFFHPFWEQLNLNQTIWNAFNFALNFIPAGRFLPVLVVQMPLMYDNMGVNTTLSFNSDPPL
jgi:hypothetical protein